MHALFARIFLFLFIWITPVLAGDESEKASSHGDINGEDMQIIAVLEILQLMDVAEQIDIFKDMDVLIEEMQNENKN